MILFLSPSFLKRLSLIWKPQLKAFLVGDRNFRFFVPDSVVETEDFSPEQIEAVIRKNVNLLGFLTEEGSISLPGYIVVNTAGVYEPQQWIASLGLLEGTEIVSRSLEVKVGE